MFKRILFAHNATPSAERALFYLEHFARLEEAEVIVLHAYQLPDRYMATSGYEALTQQFATVAQEIVDDVVEHLREAGLLARGITEAGVAARVILETARDEDVSLIVLGTRGPSSVKDVLLGDVSTEVVRYAPCPVFLVP